MYISKIDINNFRNFKEKRIEFNDGVNVIIGHNNAGKTNLIKALSLVIDNERPKRLNTDDFNKNVTLDELKAIAPKISISVTITKGREETPDDLVTVSNWLTKLDSSYEALLTYEFFLPEKKQEEYVNTLSVLTNETPNALEKAWKIIKHEFIRFYGYKIWGGKITNQTTADSESLQKFDFQFLDAIRDVERDMLTGRNTLLREVFDFFMDYEIKKDGTKTLDEKYQQIKIKKELFSEKASLLIEDLSSRINNGKQEILSYATKTGASFNKAKPDFEGSISENEMYSVLKLIVEYESGIKIPATHNGLGYNNLIFMSLLLAKMQVNADVDYLDNNAKVFTTLAIEEPEAHLHPAMQYKFLKFLNENKKEKKVRQIFVTTHSTHITSAVSLGEIICLHNQNGETKIGYPTKVFPDVKNKKYVQRFLDATKSDMLFAQKVLFVEGIAEQLLMSIFANYIGKSLEDNHVAVINIGGRYFNHFLHLFDSEKENTIPKQIVCITDRDPERKEKTKSSFKKCYPYEYNQDLVGFDYQVNPSADIYAKGTHQNITFFSPETNKGKTLEYELLMSNPSLKLLLTESIDNKEELKDLMSIFETDDSTVQDLMDRLRDSSANTRIKDSININTTFDSEEKKKSIIASRYLNSVGKGENALELSFVLSENLSKKGTDDFIEFNVPKYIKNAIEELCQ
ncbi:ATP-dependent endonuclease [Dokdonia ponticola]|uniref:ATP-dependent endonuclease n=1 Tax=Dokdonia ponticola TaxID=2041041 RepID=A0ABV9HYT2_9FLAO